MKPLVWLYSEESPDGLPCAMIICAVVDIKEFQLQIGHS